MRHYQPHILFPWSFSWKRTFFQSLLCASSFPDNLACLESKNTLLHGIWGDEMFHHFPPTLFLDEWNLLGNIIRALCRELLYKTTHVTSLTLPYFFLFPETFKGWFECPQSKCLNSCLINTNLLWPFFVKLCWFPCRKSPRPPSPWSHSSYPLSLLDFQNFASLADIPFHQAGKTKGLPPSFTSHSLTENHTKSSNDSPQLIAYSKTFHYIGPDFP